MSPPPPGLRPPAWPASAIVSILAVAMLGTWLPHYLTWPWWPDADAWATMAQGWDAGLKPYRDVTCFNFPGPILQSRLLGRVFGYGRTAPFYMLDAAMLVGLGGVLILWSRKRLGSSFAGLLGWISAVWIYCGLDYSMVAQRDWQGPLLAIASLALIQSWKGWGGTIGSAVLMACAFVIRPHVVLFFPVVVLAILCDSEGRREMIRRWAIWGGAFAVASLVVFSPLIADGLIGDLIAGVRQASYGSGYGKTTPQSVGLGVLRQLGLIGPDPGTVLVWHFVNGWKVLATLLGLVGMLVVSDRERRRMLAPWCAALAMAAMYAPLHPKAHGYLVLPLKLAWSVSWGVLAGVVIERVTRWRTAAILGFLIVAVPGIPAFCLPGEAIDAVLGRSTSRIPATAIEHFAPRKAGSPYRYDDYLAMLAYLRTSTSPETKVATVLRNVPFPAINGVVGRVSPLPAESGVIWLWSVNPRLEPRFADAVASAPKGSVVVWTPEDPSFTEALRLETLCNAIRKGYRPERRFGAFEVWRKP